MKKLLCIFSFALIFNIGNAQDIIIDRNGDEIESKVVEITTTEIKYKNFDHLDGPVRSILKSDVFMIKYENGKKELFKTPEETPTTNENTENKPTKEQNIEVIKETEINEQKTDTLDIQSEKKIKKQLPVSIKNLGIRKGYIRVNFLTLYHKYIVPFWGKGIGVNFEFPPSKVFDLKYCVILGGGLNYINISSTRRYEGECPDCWEFSYYGYDTIYGNSTSFFGTQIYMNKIIAELYFGFRIKSKIIEYGGRLGPTFISAQGSGPGDGIPDRETWEGSYDDPSYWSGYNTLGFKYGLYAKLPFFKNHGYGFIIGFDQMISLNGSLMYYFSIGLTFI